MTGAFGGLFAGCFRLAWYPDPMTYQHKNVITPLNQNLKYILQGLRGPVAWMSIACGVFTLTECVVEQLRDPEKESTWVNAWWGGMATGTVAGIMTGNIKNCVPAALGFGLIMTMAEVNGPRLAYDQEQYDRKLNRVGGLITEDSEVVKNLKKKYPEYKHL